MPRGPLFDPMFFRPDDPGYQPRKATTMQLPIFPGQSKLIGSLVGALFGYAVSKFGLPAEFATPDIQLGAVGLFSAIFTWAFPANKPT